METKTNKQKQNKGKFLGLREDKDEGNHLSSHSHNYECLFDEYAKIDTYSSGIRPKCEAIFKFNQESYSFKTTTLIKALILSPGWI